MNKNQKGFSVIETLLILAVLGLISFVGWYVFKSKNNANSIYGKVANNQSNASGVPSGFKLYKNQQLDIKFLYTSGNSEPQVSETGPDDTQTGTEYSISQPGYGDASAVKLASKDFSYKLSGDDALLQKTFGLYVGDISSSFKSEKHYIESVDKKCKNDNKILNCLKLIADKQNEISYIAFNDAVNAYLVTIKDLPSDKRLPSVAFVYRADSSTVINGKETHKTPITALVENKNLQFFNTVSNSLQSL